MQMGSPRTTRPWSLLTSVSSPGAPSSLQLLKEALETHS